MLAIKVLLFTILCLYFVGVAINAYKQFDADIDVDWEDINEEEEEKDIAIKTSSKEQFIIHHSSSDEWSEVEYLDNPKTEPITGKDLDLEINI